MSRRPRPANPFRYFKTSPEVIRLAVLMYVRFPLSLRNVEDLLFERGIDLCHETVRLWWNRFGSIFAAEVRRRRVGRMRGIRHWRWHLDEVFVRINASANTFVCSRSRGRGPGELRHENPRQGSGSGLSEESAAAAWARGDDRDGRAPLISCRDAPARQSAC